MIRKAKFIARPIITLTAFPLETYLNNEHLNSIAFQCLNVYFEYYKYTNKSRDVFRYFAPQMKRKQCSPTEPKFLRQKIVYKKKGSHHGEITAFFAILGIYKHIGKVYNRHIHFKSYKIIDTLCTYKILVIRTIMSTSII